MDRDILQRTAEQCRQILRGGHAPGHIPLLPEIEALAETAKRIDQTRDISIECAAAFTHARNLVTKWAREGGTDWIWAAVEQLLHALEASQQSDRGQESQMSSRPAADPHQARPSAPAQPHKGLARWISTVTAVCTAAAGIYGLFAEPRLAVLGFLGVVIAIVLLLVVARAAKEAQSSRSRFYGTVAKAMVAFVVLYFMVLTALLMPSLIGTLTATSSKSPAIQAGPVMPPQPPTESPPALPLGPPLPTPTPAPAAVATWDAWSAIGLGTTRSGVRASLGDPQRVSTVDGEELWSYPVAHPTSGTRMGVVKFSGDRVVSKALW